MKLNERMRKMMQGRVLAVVAAVVAACAYVYAQQAPGPPPQAQVTSGIQKHPGVNQIANPYRLIEKWPTLRPNMRWGAAISMIPDGTGGTWMYFRSEPPIVHFNAAGQITQTFGDGMFVSAHGLCRDRDGNFWAGDSGPFTESPATAGKGFQVLKFSPAGKLLMTLGKAGVSKAGPDTFVGPTACAIAPNGDIVITDGHWPRPASAQQDGDRVVRYTKEGKFVSAFGSFGTEPGQFAGPHALAFDSQGRLFVADRSNNRIQIFDKDMKYLDNWRHFGRPSGIAILKDDTLVVADSESGAAIDGTLPPGRIVRNPGWKQGIRIGSAKDGSLKYFIDGTNPEGMAADDQGNIFAGLTTGCQDSPSGGCLQKWVRK
jgi:sugar lactone lactonase YvrE